MLSGVEAHQCCPSQLTSKGRLYIGTAVTGKFRLCLLNLCLPLAVGSLLACLYLCDDYFDDTSIGFGFFYFNFDRGFFRDQGLRFCQQVAPCFRFSPRIEMPGSSEPKHYSPRGDVSGGSDFGIQKTCKSGCACEDLCLPGSEFVFKAASEAEFGLEDCCVWR